MAGDFKSAFHQLLPLAAEGIPQAEYGIGYMYYYGYGVTQDNESGIFWMNKAAAAHYAPAIRALAAIQEHTVAQAETRHSPHESAPQRINKTEAENTNSEKNTLLRTLNDAPALTPGGHVTIMPQPDETTLAKIVPKLFKETTTSATNSKYTLQLLGSYYLAPLKQRQAKLNSSTPTHIGQTKHNGRDWYVLTYGQYPALGHAELAKLDLPSKIKEFKPWIRKCDELKWVG